MDQLEIKKLLIEGGQKLGITISDDMALKFLVYKDELKEWNKKFNLTSIEDDREIIIRHFLDSLTIAKLLKGTERLLDVGSGAGLPGIPLKIVLPGLDVVLMDSVQKKVRFLEHAIGTVGLTGIKAEALRAQDKATLKQYAGSFDCVTGRALTALPAFIEICLPFVKVGGTLIAIKGPKAVEELKKVKPSRLLSEPSIQQVPIPFSDRTNTIIVYKRLA